MIGGDILEGIGGDIDKCYKDDDWNALQFACSIGDVEVVKTLLSDGAAPDFRTKSQVLPQVTPLHIAARYGHLEIVKLLSTYCDVNLQDQWGFTAIHYATVSRSKDVVLYLLGNGASAVLASKSGCTAQDLAEQLKFDDIIDSLKSKSNLELDPTVPMFKEWMNHLGGGEFTANFLEAGYDLPFIAKHGVTAEDLDSVGIPKTKMGLRRKISQLHELEKFYEAEEADEEEDDDEDEEEDDEEEEDDDDDD
mmetsp:Transcript_16954/g.28730  ORF Transcript_16954/g.28730 Transcript_16954/m.28730 type:complete len:250 (-) Transcript_16954:411-1160(-)